MTSNRVVGAAGSILLTLFLTQAYAGEADPLALADLSLEALSNTKVTSVSKRSESLADAAASVFVISGESIRRSGAATLPEVLRLAPNLQVARVDARNYAVTARGFNSAFENKLLVLIDGRSVYTPLFSGVFWDAQDVVLEDIDRIEVISGPGATLWGANAVNGVINIITKPAGATQGTLAAISGERDQQVATLRHGGRMGGARFRAYAKALTLDDLTRANGTPNLTGMRRAQVGMRADWEAPTGSTTLQADAYQGALHQAGTADITIAGANVLARKIMRLTGGTEVSAQAYWDFTERNQPNAFIEHLNTVEVQLQAASMVDSHHRLVIGGGYRRAMDRLVNGPAFGFLPGNLDMHWGNLFVQDEIDLSNSVRLIAGAKFEHNNYTGWEFLPTVRLAYKPSASSLVWGAASRTVRAPSRIDRDFYSPTNPPIVDGVPRFAIAGGPRFDSEVAAVAELGYRISVLPTMAYSVTAFVSDYERLRTLEPNPAGAGSVFSNLATGRTKGIEMWGEWRITPHLRLAGGAVVQQVRTLLEPGSKDASGTSGLATSDPSNYSNLRLSYDIAANHSIDLLLRHHGNLARPVVPAYTSADINYLWRIDRALDLAVTGRNLLDARHPEFGGPATRPEFARTLGFKLIWRP